LLNIILYRNKVEIITLTKQCSANSPAMPEVAGAPEIEITPKMIEAGVFEAREHMLGEDLADLVKEIYRAMVIEASSSASATSE
jgi:hypothetical protein